MIDPTHLAELKRERQHLEEVRIFLLNRLDEVSARIDSIDREAQQ